MAETSSGMFSHLINIVFKIQGDKEAKEAIASVEKKATQFGGTTGFGNINRISEAMYKAGASSEEAGNKIDEGAKKADKGIGLFMKSMGRALIVAPAWMLVRNILLSVFGTIQNQVKFLIDLETAMTRIKIVGKGTATELKNLQDSLVALSFAYGVSASEAIAAAQVFAQQGKSVSETIILTQQAMLAAQVLGTDVKTVVEDLTAALNGFNIPMRDSISVIDKWINVEKEFAVTAKDLSEATKTTGATANQLGVTISQFLGDVTAVIEVTRKSGAEAARGIGFMYTRLLTTAKPVIEKIAQVSFYMDKQGQVSNNLSDNLRPVADILGDLALKWDKLTIAEKLSVSESLGSKRQMVVVNALMQNYNASIDARIKAITSSGAAERAFGLVQDTAAYKFKQLETAWNNATLAFADTSSMKTATDVLNNMLTNITYLIDKEKGIRLAFAESFVKQNLGLEKQSNQIKVLQEVLDLREKIAKQPITSENTERLTNLDKYISEVSNLNPTIKAAIELGDKVQLRREIEKINKEFVIKINTKSIYDEFMPAIDVLHEEIANLEQSMRFTGGTDLIEKQKQLEVLNQKLSKLYAEQGAKSKEVVAQKLAEYELSKGSSDLAEIARLEAGQLTDAEEAKFEIEKKLLDFKSLNKTTTEQQLQYERELIDNADVLYDKHAKSVELARIDVKLAEEKNKRKEEERNKLEDLVIQYASANEKERRDIRRLMELQQQSPEGVAAAFTGSDEQLILKNINSFTEEVKQRIASLIAAQEGLSGINQPTPFSSKSKSLYDFSKEGPALSTRNNMAPQIDVPITIIGAVTDSDLDILIREIQRKIKEQPNFLSTEQLNKMLDAIKNSDELSKKSADINRRNI